MSCSLAGTGHYDEPEQAGRKDRERARNDYMVNLKSELEIRMLHEKIDHLMLHQQQELIEVQKFRWI
jgi:uncharacterized membrane protein